MSLSDEKRRREFMENLDDWRHGTKTGYWLAPCHCQITPKKSEEIAKKIVETRKNKKIETTFELKHLLNELGLGQKACAVIFQAFRIETNKEIDNVKMLLGEIPNILSE